MMEFEGTRRKLTSHAARASIGVGAAFVVAAALMAAACNQEAISTPTPDPRFEELQSIVGSLSRQVAELQRTPTATATSLPTATPGPTLSEFVGLVAQRVEAELKKIPSVTPAPTATPAPFPTPAPTATPAPFPTPLPTATPVSIPALVALVPQVSGPAIYSFGPPSEATIMVDPGRPLAGRDVHFTIEGLEPWQFITVEFIDPLGRPAPWVSEGEVLYTSKGSQKRLYADENGTVRWVRIGAQDSEGIWTVRIIGLRQPTNVTYPVADLQIPLQGYKTLGVELRVHQGTASNVYFSAGVPAALAVDAQAHLAFVNAEVHERLAIRSGRIPDLYLVWGSESFKALQAALGIEFDVEPQGFHWGSSSPNPGIYVNAELFRSGLWRTIAHEFIHLVQDELTGGGDLLVWLAEGLAVYMAYEIGLETSRPQYIGREYYSSIDLAVTAAQEGSLLPLSAGRQGYAQAHMAVRFMVETFGPASVVEVTKMAARGEDMDDILQQTIGLTLEEFEDQFHDYLKTWQDPTREAVREYTTALEQIIERKNAITDVRAEIIDRPRSEKVPIYAGMVSDVMALLAELEQVDLPEEMEELHAEALSIYRRIEEWFSIEHEYAQNGSEELRLTANEIIRELTAREASLRGKLSDAIYNYQLGG